MIISRREFHQRYMSGSFKTIKEKNELMSVDQLFKEIKADAPFRNHQYMFKKGIDLKKLALQEDEVGIKKKHPHIKTEHQRLKLVEKEILDDTYKAIPISCDIDSPDDFYVEDGFHRIFSAYKKGFKVIRVKRRYGKFMLSNSITFTDLSYLLGMLIKMFGKEYLSMKSLKKFLDKINPKLLKNNKNYSVGYGGEKR